LDLLTAIVRQEITDVEGLAFVPALDVRPDFEDFFTDIAVAVNCY
jgi:hypothetical protein